MRKSKKNIVNVTIEETEIEIEEPTVEEMAEIESEQFDYNFENSDDCMKMYLHDISQFELLTREEEIELSKKVHDGIVSRDYLNAIKENGDIKEWEESDIAIVERTIKNGDRAREKMVNHNLRLVVSVAKKYNWTNMDIMDLIQDGTFGLMTAVEKFDYRKGYKFSTYATWWIRHSINQSVYKNNNNIRIPAYMIELKKKVNNAINELYDGDSTKVDANELADFLNMEVEKVKEVIGISVGTISIDAKVGDDDNSTISDFVRNSDATNPEKIAEMSNLHELLEEIIDSVLKPKEATVIRMYYGMEDGSARTYDEIGNVLNITRQRVQQIEKKAKEKMKKSEKFEMLIDFIK